jgi:NADPH-dependent curcumin reductase
MNINRKLVLQARPDGLPKDSDFVLQEEVLADLVEGEVRVAVRFVSIDPAMRVWMSEAKSYWPPVALGETMRASAIGEVQESRHADFPQGAWVTGMLGVQTLAQGNGKGLRVFDATRLPAPEWALSVFGGTGLTAWFGLREIGMPKPGEVLVVSAAAGAVGSMVAQIGREIGCRVIGIAGGPEKCRYLIETLGCAAAIDYKNESIGEAIKRECPDGVDVYFDNVGGETLDAVLKRLRLGARIVLCGGISQYNSTGDVLGPKNYLNLIAARARMQGFVVIDYLSQAERAFAELGPWVAQGKIHSRHDIAEGLEQFPEALRRVYLGKNFGKQLLRLNDSSFVTPA